jgi:hypothetical protein
MKHLCLSSMFLLLAVSIHAQEISASVLAAGGGFGSNSSGMLSYTVGEMTAVATFVSPAAFLTQGFQQPWDLKTQVIDVSGSALSVGVYPNPNNGTFTVQTVTGERIPLSMHLHSLLGTEVHTTDFLQDTEEHLEHISVTHLPAGMYILSVRDHQQVLSLAKIQIIR